MMHNKRINLSVSYSTTFPMYIINGIIISNTEEHHLDSVNSFPNIEWGNTKSYNLITLDSLPKSISLEYIDIAQQCYYFVIIPFKMETIDNINKDYSKITIGIAPNLHYAIWLSSLKKRILFKWVNQDEIKCNYTQHITDDVFNEYKELIKHDNIIPIREHLVDLQMKQFVYKYIILQWIYDKSINNNIIDNETLRLEYIEEYLCDGTFDKYHNDSLFKYHKAGKPKKIAIKWHIKKSEYTAYFWFEDEKICSIFERFYGAHPDTKTDFIIRIDAENKKYELALYRYGLKEPQVIPEDVYQLLVFKNKFEDYRSDNYNQECGAWIW